MKAINSMSVYSGCHSCVNLLYTNAFFHLELYNETKMAYLRNRPALAVNCCVIIHCLEVSCKEDQITSAQRE